MATSPYLMNERTPAAAKYHAQIQIRAFGWYKKEWVCLASLWGKESAWNPNARNKVPVAVLRDGKRVRLHAGGIPQILGLNPRTSVPMQVQRGLTYIDSRYNSPCQAWRWWRAHGWY